MDAFEAHAKLRWFFRHPSGAQGGPLTTTEVIQGLLDRTVPVDSELCEADGGTWRPARQVDQFRIATRAVRASLTRKESQPPPPTPAAPSTGADEEDIKTRYYGTGAEVEEVEGGLDAVQEVDEDDLKTKYYGADGDKPKPPGPIGQPAAPPPRVPSVPLPPAPRAQAVPLPPAPRAQAVPLPQAPRAQAVPLPPAPLSRSVPLPPAPQAQAVPLPQAAPAKPAPPPPAAAAGEEDEEEIRTRCYEPGSADDGAARAPLPVLAPAPPIPAPAPVPAPARAPAAAPARPPAPSRPSAPAIQKAEETEEEELRTAYYQPGGKKVEDDEEEVRTKYYRGGDAGPKSLPTFDDIAAGQLAAATAAPLAAPQPAPATQTVVSAVSVPQPAAPLQYAAPQPSVMIPNEPVPAAAPMAPQAQISRRDATQPALVLPANAPRFTTQPKGPGIPWGRLALMAVGGAVVGLLVVLVLAVVMRLTGR